MTFKIMYKQIWKIIFFVKKIIFAATGLGHKMVEKRHSFLEPKIKNKLFFFFNYNNIKYFFLILKMYTGLGIPVTRILVSGCTANLIKTSLKTNLLRDFWYVILFYIFVQQFFSIKIEPLLSISFLTPPLLPFTAEWR